MTREEYIQYRSTGRFDGSFIYSCYKDEGHKDYNFTEFMYLLELKLFKEGKSKEGLVNHLVKLYDSKYELKMLFDKNNLIKIW